MGNTSSHENPSSSTKENKSSPVNVPKNIHFFWAGGVNLPGSVHFNNIIEWVKNNRDFECCLWVDISTWKKPNDFDDLRNKYQREFDTYLKESKEEKQGQEEENQNIKVIFPCSSKIQHTKSSNNTSLIIQLHDIKELEELKMEIEEDILIKVLKFIHYEIRKLRPNYGASSDLLRYLILYLYGGVCADSDVKQGVLSLIQAIAFMQTHTFPVLMVDSNSQGSGCIGNDAFICSQYNPLMKKILKVAINNYVLKPNDNKVLPQRFERAYFLDQTRYYTQATIARTGPGLIRSQLGILSIPETKEAITKDTVEDFLQDEDCFRQAITLSNIYRMSGITKPAHGTNTHSWVNIPITRLESLEEALERVYKTIDIELEEMGILRLDDHIDHILASLGNERPEVQTIVDRLIPYLAKHASEVKKSIWQVTGRYLEILAYYQEIDNGIFPKIACQNAEKTVEAITYLIEIENYSDLKISLLKDLLDKGITSLLFLTNNSIIPIEMFNQIENILPKYKKVVNDKLHLDPQKFNSLFSRLKDIENLKVKKQRFYSVNRVCSC